MEDQVIYSKTNLSAVIYARVSTNDQSYQSQIAG
jgi:predicted site-specific integrase-resolvase